MNKKKVANRGSEEPELTPIEAEVLYLLTKEFLTVKQIAIRRQKSTQSIYNIRQNLRKKGVIDSLNKEVAKTRGTLQPFATSGHKIRLHGQEFNIKILYKDRRYKEHLAKHNTLYIDGNTIRLYRDSIEVYGTHSFYAETAQKATARSMVYWRRFFTRLEHDLKVILVKNRYNNIKLVNHHYSEIDNELARECNIKADKIRVYTTEDSKLWFMIDNSFNLDEAETLHPETAKQDMQDIVSQFFNTLRDNPQAPSMIQLIHIIKSCMEIQKETAAGLLSVVKILEPPNSRTNGIDRTRPPQYIG